MTACRKIRLASATLAFMLFSALSPAMAAALFAGNPEVLGRMLNAPAPAPAPDTEGHEHHAAHAGHGAGHQHHAAGQPADTGNTNECADHGVFCSFCLNATSTTTLLPDAVALVFYGAIAGEKVLFHPADRPVAIRAGARHLRDPPLLSS